MMSSAVIILTTLGESVDGIAFGKALVDERLAACVNVLPPMVSVYRWKGTVEREREQQLVIKTTRDRVARIEGLLRERHPYELPEFIVLDASASALYLQWLHESVAET
jgi:periplasmic divalent cation tolerance protein